MRHQSVLAAFEHFQAEQGKYVITSLSPSKGLPYEKLVSHMYEVQIAFLRKTSQKNPLVAQHRVQGCQGQVYQGCQIGLILCILSRLSVQLVNKQLSPWQRPQQSQ